MVILKKGIWNLVIIATAAITVLLLYFFLFPVYNAYFPKCLFFTFTGYYCPGCGSQRAITALLHLDILTAMHQNLLAVIATPFLFYALAVFCLNSVRTKKIQLRFFYDPVFVRVVLFSVLVFALLRNIPVYPFTLLAPF